MDSLIRNIIRVGIVSSLEEGAVRVAFPDKDDTVSAPLPVVFAQTGANKVLALPGVGESVLCLFMGNGLQNGFCLGSFYNSEDPPPAQEGVWFEDGSFVRYDSDNQTLIIKTVGSVQIEGDLSIAGSLAATGKLSIGGDLTVNGSITATGPIHGGDDG